MVSLEVVPLFTALNFPFLALDPVSKDFEPNHLSDPGRPFLISVPFLAVPPNMVSPQFTDILSYTSASCTSLCVSLPTARRSSPVLSVLAPRLS